MKINLNNKEYLRCAEFLNVKEQNICAAEIYIEYLNNHYNEIKQAKDENDFYSQFLNCLEINPNDKQFKEINRVTNVEKIDCLNPRKFVNNDYYQLFKNLQIQNNDVCFCSLKYEPYEAFVYDELIIDQKYYSEHTPLGYFKESFYYPAIIKNEQIWMSIIPHEIATMEQPIKNAKGRVLVLGLGLGYYLFNIVNKKDVDSVDVVEFDKSIISIFNKHLFDRFPHKDKINIIFDDALNYLKNNKKHYDYVFSDIWHNVADGEMLYLKIKKFESDYKDTKFDYWIETSILSMLRRQTLTVFEEICDGAKDSDYLKAKNENDQIINSIYFYLKNTEVNCFDALHNILSDSFLKEMAKHLL